MGKRKKVNFEATLKTLGRALARVARAADRDLPGITCEQVAGKGPGHRFDVVGIGQLYFWNDGMITLGNEGIDLRQVPGIGLVDRSLMEYAKRREDERLALREESRRYALRREAERIRTWRPRVLTDYVKEQEARAQADRESGPDDGAPY